MDCYTYHDIMKVVHFRDWGSSNERIAHSEKKEMEENTSIGVNRFLCITCSGLRICLQLIQSSK